MDQRHEQIADLRAVQRAIEQSIFPVQNSALQTALDDIMPLPGLCRADWLQRRPVSIPAAADAA
jgi:hypothetical protein